VLGRVPPRHGKAVLPSPVVDGPHHPQLFQLLDLLRGQTPRGELPPLFRDSLPQRELDAVVVDVDVVDLHPQVGVGTLVPLRGGRPRSQFRACGSTTRSSTTRSSTNLAISTGSRRVENRRIGRHSARSSPSSPSTPCCSWSSPPTSSSGV